MVINTKAIEHRGKSDEYFQSSGTEKLSKIVCPGCGIDLHLMPQDEIVALHGERYCDICGKRLLKEESEKHALFHIKCSVCGTEHPKSQLHFVDEQALCEECFCRKFSDLSIP